MIPIHEGKQQSRNVFLDGGLRSAFQQLLELPFLRWPNPAEPEYPFRHLENDGVWALVPIEGASDAPRAAKEGRAEAWDVLRHLGWIGEERRGNRESAVGASSSARPIRSCDTR